MNDGHNTDDEHRAAEYALGLLEGEELLAARAHLARDPSFAAMVGRWERDLAPLLEEIAGRDPPPELWPRIAAAIDARTATDPVVRLTRQVRLWQRAAAGAAITAVAALATFFLAPQTTTNPLSGTPPPLVASIPIGDAGPRLALTYLPGERRMLVSASGLTADGVHDHELWLVPRQGELRSLGVVRPGEEVSVAVAPETAALILDGSPLVLTREPLGGKPAGAAAGPIVAEGALTAI